MNKRLGNALKRLSVGLTGLGMASLLTVLALHRNSAIRTDVWINAPPSAVWRVLTATDEYPKWNPMISRLDGRLRVGSVIEFTEGTGPDSMTFRPTILAVRPEQELRWEGHVGRPGLFDGEHRFTL